MSIPAILTDFVLDVIQKVRGKANDVTAENIARIVAERLEEKLLAAVVTELRTHQAALEMVLAFDELADAALEVVRAMRDAEKTPSILPPIEIMPASWTPPPDEK